MYFDLEQNISRLKNRAECLKSEIYFGKSNQRIYDGDSGGLQIYDS